MNEKHQRVKNLTLIVALVVVIGLICVVALAGIMADGTDEILIAGLCWAG